MEFTQKIRLLLKTRRLSQAELAELVGTSQQQVSRWLESNTPPRAGSLLRLARVLEVSADYLIDPAQNTYSPPVLSSDEQVVLDLYRALQREYGRGEALLRLTRAIGEAHAGQGRGSSPVSADTTATAPFLGGSERDLTALEAAKVRKGNKKPEKPPAPADDRKSHESSSRS